MTQSVPLFIGGEFCQSQTNEWVEVTNPATSEVIAKLPCATEQEMEQAIQNADEVFKSWKEVAVSERARLMLRYQHLLKEHHDELAELLSKETGKSPLMRKVTSGEVLKWLNKLQTSQAT